ncbi:conserved hypothetical protein [Talaromyces stipitatus ATCC 10500]|uniref:FAD-binding PCMH-type domain-containing protein n=1 Tax=Talaromyces stipitatus (strain ATCC 10500 / CBS 375.48 / QM 6759 / NRRL 1006) TaxID=441959 RepID=B8MEP8_TALSN|nr:uncharacterized protein TSTA_019900 [Talaromyces stipitatus ATCC 10500]EED16931.1 conserved hypothetical protein [Talaromyces stipitatus ATCC 10500]
MRRVMTMATLESLKRALWQKADDMATAGEQRLSDAQYSAGFDILIHGPGWTTYDNSIILQLQEQLSPLFDSRRHISVLEIGPGPESILGSLPLEWRDRVETYTAFEPNDLFATKLLDSLDNRRPWTRLRYLKSPPDIRRTPFVLDNNILSGASDCCGKYDTIFLCHSMYGMKPKNKFIEQVIKLLAEGGIAVVFHRHGALDLDGLKYHRMNSFPTGVVSVLDEDDALDRFTASIVGCTMQDADLDKAMRIEWRKACRSLARREDSEPGQLLFSATNVMMTFTALTLSLLELNALVPFVNEDCFKTIKSHEARFHHPASIVKPTEVQQIQECVHWALNHGLGLTVVGGGHSGHCLWPDVVAIDMSAFRQVHILKSQDEDPLVVAEAGCNTGEIIRETMKTGLTVPLGARPSVGAGSWLQGGIGHLARLHGLACDSIVGAVIVSVKSGHVLYAGNVPSEYRPAGAIRPENEDDLLWAIKGAGTNFGIIVSVTFKAYTAPRFSVRNWVLPMSDDIDTRLKLKEFYDRIAKQLPKNTSTDAYLFWDLDKLHLGVTMFEASSPGSSLATMVSTAVNEILGLEIDSKAVNCVELFETDMYMSKLHGGHGGGKTSSFKRCVFLKNIGEDSVANLMISAVKNRPTPLCYLHLLQGGGAVADVAADATAFGSRDWDFACIITGVWPRDEDDTADSERVKLWVYKTASDLLSLGTAAYNTDLGPDPRDAVLTAKIFRGSLSRLKDLKRSLDPHIVLAYACPILEARLGPKLIFLVTGKSGVGKDHCAKVWVEMFDGYDNEFKMRAVSISDVLKRKYAAARGADLNMLLNDRAYKEQHRAALTEFFQEQVRNRPKLPEENFLNLVSEHSDADVLLITGMRDEAPLAAFSHLVPDSRLLDVRVQASEEMRRIRRGCSSREDDGDRFGDNRGSDSTTLEYRPSFVFDNNTNGVSEACRFFRELLLLFLNEDLQKLADMVPRVIDFPSPGIEFRNVLGIAKQKGGLGICISRLKAHFPGDWSDVDAIVSCEVGGFVFASPLAVEVDVPLVLIREAGKLPSPTVSVKKTSSYISSLEPNKPKEKVIEIEQNAISRDASVVVVDDVLSTGETLCAVLELLEKAGIGAENVSVMVVAEFTAHRGRQLLRERGFGKVYVQSLLVFGGP